MQNIFVRIPRECHSNSKFLEYWWLLFCLCYVLPTSVWVDSSSATCSVPLTNLHHLEYFWGLWWEKDKLENLASVVKWLSLHHWNELTLWLQKTWRSQYNPTMRWAEECSNSHRAQSFNAVKKCDLELHRAVLVTYCKLEFRHIITPSQHGSRGM